MDSAKASAPGNLFLTGEHAVVYGKPAIIAAVNKRAYCTSFKSKGNTISVISREFGIAKAKIKENNIVNHEGKNELFVFFDLVEMLMHKHDIRDGLEIRIESDVPVESGLSSSTATLSAALYSLNLLFDLRIKKENFFDYLYPLQVKIHGGKASGSEIFSSSIGGYNKIQKIDCEGKTKINSKELGKHSFSIVIGNTKVRAPTALTVGMHVPSLMRRFPNMVEKEFEKIESICEKIEKALEAEDIYRIGKLINKNQKILSKLGLSHPKIDDCINEALHAGALGAKLSGGGWGGVMFALAKRGEEEKIAKAIESTGAEAIITTIGGEGVKACD
ncbi:MAG: mevalonate kinase [Candidatus Diapherotrites archaeon]|nr:mevalonate kinase [Candidatus Diapherotrites archaeon]